MGIITDGPVLFIGSCIHGAPWRRDGAFAGILLSLIGSMIDMRAVVMIGVIMSVLGMFSIAAMSILNQGRRRTQRVSKKPDSLSKADTTNKLPPMSAINHFTSVTENTTDLLKEPVNRIDLNRRS